MVELPGNDMRILLFYYFSKQAKDFCYRKKVSFDFDAVLSVLVLHTCSMIFKLLRTDTTHSMLRYIIACQALQNNCQVLLTLFLSEKESTSE